MGLNFDFNDFKETFHPESFGLGVLAGWATSYALYRARHALGSARSAVSGQASSAQEFASRGADSRYIGDILKYCQSTHLAGGHINLSEILVEPRFLPGKELTKPEDDEITESVFHVIPHIHDFPYLHAPYNLSTLSIEELDNGDRAIALLGVPGSGRTTALLGIALWSMGKVAFNPPVDKVQQQLAEEDDKITNDEERAQRILNRLQAEKMALASLAKKRGIEVEDITGGGASRGVSMRQMTPMYAHCGNILFQGREFGRTIDPAEPLLRAIQHHVSGITARTLPPNFYTRLNEGKILLLLDGFDELPKNEQPRLLNWLEAYLSDYGNNMLIATGPASGYGGLVRVGLAPVFLRPWNDIPTDRLADVWAENWSSISKKRRGPELDERTLASAKARNRARTPFDLTSKLWATYATQERTTAEERMTNIITNLLPNNSLEKMLPELTTAAVLQLDEGYFTPRRLAEILTDLAPPTMKSGEETGTIAADATDEAEIDDFDDFDEEEDPGIDDLLDDEEDDDFDEAEEDHQISGDDVDLDESSLLERPDLTPEAKKQLDKATSKYENLIEQWEKSGMAVVYRKGRFQLRHPLVTAYLASLHFKQVDDFDRDEVLIEKAFDPAWQDALVYAAIHTPLDAVVQARLDAGNDILQNTLLDLTRWLPYAPSDAPWRKLFYTTLGRMFLAPNQYLLVRERIAAALVGIRDRNVMVIFKRGFAHPDPDVRRLSCLATGALQVEKVIEDLLDLLADEEEDVMLSAGLALGAIGTEAALDEMWEALTNEGNSDTLRKAIAEAFAAIPDEGYPILYNASFAESEGLRRAAMFGLRRINASWALIVLNSRMLEDVDFRVRTAAEMAFEDMQYGDRTKGIKKLPAVESIPWLREWVMELGDEAGAADPDADSSQLLQKALDSNEADIQQLSAANIGELGIAAYTGLLYKALRHREDFVREAAFRALGNIQAYVGENLPSPM